MAPGSNGAVERARDGVGERRGRRIVDEHAGVAGDDGFDARRRGRARRPGRPHACASSGTMPKSSSPGSSVTAGAAIQVADVLVGHAAEKLGTAGARGPLERGASGPSPTIVSGTPASAARLDGHVDALVGHERRHDQRRIVRAPCRPGERSRCRRADTPQSPRDYSIGAILPAT